MVDAKHPFLPLVTNTIDNLGLKTTGEWEIGTTITMGDLLGLYDSWSVGYKSSSQIYDGKIGSDQYNASVSVPYGYWTLTLSGNYFDYKSILPNTNYPVLSTGDSIYATADLERVIYRDQDSKTRVDAFINYKDVANFYRRCGDGTGSRKLNVWVSGLSHTQRIFGGLFDGDINAQFGVPMFGTLDGCAVAAGHRAEGRIQQGRGRFKLLPAPRSEQPRHEGCASRVQLQGVGPVHAGRLFTTPSS